MRFAEPGFLHHCPAADELAAAGRWLLFSAYVAHNICLPNLVLKLAPPLQTPAYVASNEALGSVFHAAATIAGGMAFDWLRTHSTDSAAEPYRSCLIILAVGLAMRSFAIVLLAAIDEPGAWTWRQIVAAERRAALSGIPQVTLASSRLAAWKRPAV